LINLKNIKKVFLLLFIISIVTAVPRFAVKNGTTCNQCHVNPTGGAMRNYYGTTVYSTQYLPMERLKQFSNEFYMGLLGDHLRIGGDFRVQEMKYNYKSEENLESKNALLVMQGDIYANLDINEKASIYYKTGINTEYSKPEFWTMVNFLEDNILYFKIGRGLPNFGFRIDDHTAFIRGGNHKIKYGFNKEGMVFNPMSNIPGIFEIGFYQGYNTFITGSIANSYINGSAVYGKEKFKNKNLALKINYNISLFNKWNLTITPSIMSEGNIKLKSAAFGASNQMFTWLYEIDRADNWVLENIKSEAVYHELEFDISSGIQLIGKYDFFDPDIDVKDGAIHRYTIGVEIFPFNMMGIMILGRKTFLDKINLIPEPELIFQVHSYF
jgi:hypothetical protein